MVKSKAVLLEELSELIDKLFSEELKKAVEEARGLIKPEHQEAFEFMIDGLEVNQKFIAYWEQDPNCQKAVNRVFELLANSLEKTVPFVRELGAITL